MVTTSMPQHLNLIRRILSSLILIPVALLILFKGGDLVKKVTVVILGIGMAYEWGMMSKVRLAQLSTPILVVLFALLHVSSLPTPLAFALILPLFFIYGAKEWVYSLGTLYILMATLCLFNIVSAPPLVLLWILGIAWTGDIFAYIAGRSFGGPKLWTAVSPNKTWSGLIGGTLMATILGGILGWQIGISQHALVLSFILSLSGHLGDLLESASKRYYEVKDSGNLIPGHGGLLDRLDSLLLMSIVFITASFILKISIE